VAHPTTRLPKLRHQKSRDLAVVRIDGKDHYLGKFGSPESVEKYHRVVGEWMVRGADVSAPEKGSPVTTPNPTVSELTLAYYNHAVLYYQKSDGSPGSEVAKIKLVVRPLRALYGSTFARDFGPVALKAVRQSMVDAGLARRTVNQRIARIVRLFGHAVENELIPASIHHALKAVSGLRAGRSGAREAQGHPARRGCHGRSRAAFREPTGLGHDRIAAAHRNAIRRSDHHAVGRHRHHGLGVDVHAIEPQDCSPRARSINLSRSERPDDHQAVVATEPRRVPVPTSRSR
jgi:hypothetical protein